MVFTKTVLARQSKALSKPLKSASWMAIAMLTLSSTACSVHLPYGQSAPEETPKALTANNEAALEVDTVTMKEPALPKAPKSPLMSKAPQAAEPSASTKLSGLNSNQMSNISSAERQAKRDYIDTQPCPANFYDVEIPQNGKICQLFASELPASIVFFVPQQPDEVLRFYTQDTSQFSTSISVQHRYVLHSHNNNSTVIISKDGEGSQVDILVNNAN